MADIIFPGQVPGGTLGAEFLPANFNLVLYRGDYLNFKVTVQTAPNTPVNLTGYTAKCQIRNTIDGDDVYEATVVVENAANGIVDVLFPSTLTRTIGPGDFVWDFEITNPSGNTRTYIAGDVVVHGDVTTP